MVNLPFQCPTCGKGFLNLLGFRKHKCKEKPMTNAMDEALVTAHRELIRAELAYCRAAMRYAGFIVRHTKDANENAKWAATLHDIEGQYAEAQARAVQLGIELDGR